LAERLSPFLLVAQWLQFWSGSCPNPFSPVLKRFLTGLLQAMPKLALRAQTVGIAVLPLSQDLWTKNVSMNRSKGFSLGQQPVVGRPLAKSVDYKPQNHGFRILRKSQQRSFIIKSG
jgi:hypothetical protein